MEFDEVTIGITGLTLSALIWRKYRRCTPGLVEQTLDANPGLAAHVFLPLGLKVRLPRLRDEPQAATVVPLWGDEA